MAGVFIPSFFWLLCWSAVRDAFISIEFLITTLRIVVDTVRCTFLLYASNVLSSLFACGSEADNKRGTLVQKTS